MHRVLLIAFLFAASGCGYYTHVSTVQRDPLGGTLAVGNDRGSHDEARRRMHEHCGGVYEIVDQHRVVVGQKSTARDDGETVVTEDIHETQISYQCAAAPAE